MRGAAIAATLALAGCAGTQFREMHVLQARNGTDDVAYYRLTIEGDAQLAKTHYRAGLYDADAIDALFGVMKAGEENVDDIIDKRRRAAIDKLAHLYYRALEDGKDGPELEQVRRSLVSAMTSPNSLTSEIPAWDQHGPRRKYAIIYSSVASEVEEAIARFAEERETADQIVGAIASVKRQIYIGSQVRKDAFAAGFGSLEKIEERLKEMGPLPDTADALTRRRYAEELRRLLDDVASVTVP